MGVENQATQDKLMVPVDAKALQTVLNALYGPPHHIRELRRVW